ncbi:MAG: isoprenyl transferase [Pedosphaera sp.]|nr:isoprenyl transferase [Pedosphaera sp.]
MSRSLQLSPEAKATLPMHVAVIMDGNGRWAKKRFLPRAMGHLRGIDSVCHIVRAAGDVGVKFLTLYAFSVQNWNRPKAEVEALMQYLVRFLKKEEPELAENNVRLEVIGQIHRLPEPVQKQLAKTQAALGRNNGLTLILSLSYGGREEIVEAARTLARKAKSGDIDPAEINEQVFAQHLYTRHYPDPDLLIRTSGELRVSNFLLWQISYAEIIVTPTLWPDFRKAEFYAALEEYAKRQRRFGGV